MKATLNYFFIFFVFVLGMMMQTSCTNKCGTTTCQNGGTCTNNKCVCPKGYSNTSCQTAWDDEYIGTYNCKHIVCTPAVADTAGWQSAITKSSTDGGYTVNISNFDNSNTTQVATIDSLGNLKIAPAAGSYGVSATGTYNSGTVTLNFTNYVTGGSSLKCTVNMVKL